MESVFDEACATYTGISDALLREQSSKWFRESVAPHLRPGARELLAKERARGSRLVLASSTTQYAAAEAVACFGLADAVSSVLQARRCIPLYARARRLTGAGSPGV